VTAQAPSKERRERVTFLVLKVKEDPQSSTLCFFMLYVSASVSALDIRQKRQELKYKGVVKLMESEMW
jgi:hypothetical protein